MTADGEVAEGGSETLARFGWASLGILLILLAGVLWATSTKAARDGRLLVAEGAAIDAIVIAKDTRTLYHRRHTSTEYVILWVYSPPRLGQFEVQESVSQGRYQALDVGDQFRIRFVPSQPRLYEVEPGATAASAETLRKLAAGLMIAAIGAAFWPWRPRRKAVSLF